MMTDPIADMLTRIRNAVRVERPHVQMPASKVKKGLAEVLKREGYIWDWEELEAEPARQLRIYLKYGPNGERVIRHSMVRVTTQKVSEGSNPTLSQFEEVDAPSMPADPQSDPDSGENPNEEN